MQKRSHLHCCSSLLQVTQMNIVPPENYSKLASCRLAWTGPSALSILSLLDTVVQARKPPDLFLSVLPHRRRVRVSFSNVFLSKNFSCLGQQHVSLARKVRLSSQNENGRFRQCRNVRFCA